MNNFIRRCSFNLEYGTILLDVVTILTIFDILTLMYSLLKIVF